MPEATATFEVRRNGPASIVDIRGEVTAGSEAVLMSAYDESADARAIVLNFTHLSYMNSGGIGLLVTLRRRTVPSRWSFLLSAISSACLVVLLITGVFLTIRPGN